METYFLSIPLPVSLCARLAALCYGLPHVHWMDQENLMINLRFFGSLTDQECADIQNRLKTLFFVKFPLFLKGIGLSNSKGSRGTIWVGVEPAAQLNALRKEIHQQLKELQLRPEERSFHPHVLLGRYDHLNHLKLSEFLMMHAEYQSEPFTVSCCQLLTSHQTPKRLFYSMEQQINASEHATGED